jgi:uncharacterized coiled-coil DUF342 family protein
MLKFFFKLTTLVVLAYLLMQIPAVSKLRDQIKADIMEKVNNVNAEVDRIKGKVEGVEQKAAEVKDRIDTVSNQVTDTVNNVKDAFNTVDNAVTDVKKALNGEGEKVTEGLQNPVTTTPTTTEPVPTPATN